MKKPYQGHDISVKSVNDVSTKHWTKQELDALEKKKSPALNKSHKIQTPDPDIKIRKLGRRQLATLNSMAKGLHIQTYEDSNSRTSISLMSDGGDEYPLDKSVFDSLVKNNYIYEYDTYTTVLPDTWTTYYRINPKIKKHLHEK